MIQDDVAQEHDIALTEFSDKPWDGSSSRFTLEQWHNSCLIHLHSGGAYTKGDCKLPIKEPSGVVNKAALRNAAARINQVQGAPPEEIASAKSTLKRLMQEAGMNTSLEEEANDTREEDDSPETLIHQFQEALERLKGFVWPQAVSEEAALSGPSSEEDDEILEEVAYQLPYEFSEPQKIGKRIWRKQLARLGQKIHHDDAPGGLLEYTKGYLQTIVDNYKQGAFYRVYATLKHSTEAQDCNGVARDLFLKMDGDPETDGLYGDFELGPDAEKIVEANGGEIGSSVCLHHGRLRKADKKRFGGPSLQHVALVPRPYDQSLRPWVPVALSEETEVVDLTEAENLENPRKEAEPVREVVDTPTQQEEEVREVNNTVSLEEFNALKEQLEARLAEERKEREATAKELEEQRVEARLTREFASVIPAFREEVKAIVLCDAAKAAQVYLSEDGMSETVSQRMWRILEMVKDSDKPNQNLVVSFSEEGREDIEPTTGDSEADLDKRIKQIMREKNLAYEPAFEVALAEVSE